MKIKKTIKCPKCGHEYESNFWLYFDIDESPDIKKEIFTGHFFSRTCPLCKKTYLITHDVMIESKNNKFLLIYCSDPLLSEHLAYTISQQKSSSPWLKYETIRVMNDVRTLQEKLRILDSKKDDRIIELIKVCTLESVGKENVPNDITDILCWIENNENLTIDLFGDKQKTYKFNKELYNDFEKRFKNLLNANSSEYIVDVEWALSLLYNN